MNNFDNSGVGAVDAGKKAEEQFIIELNGDKKDPRWQTLKIKNAEEYFAIRVTKKVPSKKLGHLANAKADVYIASGKLEQSLLEDKKFFLTDDDVEDIGLSRKVGTGISVKRTDSEKYQIHKWGPDSFKKIFGSYELGAGISIYRNRSEELVKNDTLLSGWKTSWKEFEDYFSDTDNIKILKDKSAESDDRKEVAKKVGTYSIKIAEDKIRNDANISDHVFCGSNDFDEPYNATWFFAYGILVKAIPFPINVTTGSGRTKGDYTVVVKPVAGSEQFLRQS